MPRPNLFFRAPNTPFFGAMLNMSPMSVFWGGVPGQQNRCNRTGEGQDVTQT